ncbi:LOB domain-containing protein [Musa troglodytarum]|uniref:LOB domain-containing protein n=1 Tax=Musa troglodytarum TaxID=320322 RepID=A0A9E7EJ25_9LILI|nr:LOB domain-containing protein [Musa troglodytarum]
MRMSCNGCRVLRKGCSDDCSIRPCLQWIRNPESQANATVFLAKFYGRAGLMNLINAGPEHLRSAIFRSLLYEACGRIVNPIYGSVGLLWSGSWQLCQAAVEAVLRGSPIVQIPSETAAATPVPALKAYDIRHVAKDAELHKVNKNRTRFKRPGAKPRRLPTSPVEPGEQPEPAGADLSHESAASHASQPNAFGGGGDGDGRENESVFSADAASHVSQGELSPAEEGEVGLELTLGLETGLRPDRAIRPAGDARCDVSRLNADTCKVDLCLQLPVA